MIKHVRQQYGECFIASIAMVENLDYAVLRADRPPVKNGGITINRLIKWLDKHGLGHYAASLENVTWNPGSPGIGGDDAPNLDGRGVIIVRYDGFVGHAMAYENGLIFDPGQYAPGHGETWDMYRARCAGVAVQVCAIIPKS